MTSCKERLAQRMKSRSTTKEQRRKTSKERVKGLMRPVPPKLPVYICSGDQGQSDQLSAPISVQAPCDVLLCAAHLLLHNYHTPTTTDHQHTGNYSCNVRMHWRAKEGQRTPRSALVAGFGSRCWALFLAYPHIGLDQGSPLKHSIAIEVHYASFMTAVTLVILSASATRLHISYPSSPR
jgi:hypothetical protein